MAADHVLVPVCSKLKCRRASGRGCTANPPHMHTSQFSVCRQRALPSQKAGDSTSVTPDTGGLQGAGKRPFIHSRVASLRWEGVLRGEVNGEAGGFSRRILRHLSGCPKLAGGVRWLCWIIRLWLGCRGSPRLQLQLLVKYTFDLHYYS